jgi:hypothetical protein
MKQLTLPPFGLTELLPQDNGISISISISISIIPILLPYKGAMKEVR